MNPSCQTLRGTEDAGDLAGKPYATASARSYQGMKGELLPVVLEALEDLRRRFE